MTSNRPCRRKIGEYCKTHGQINTGGSDTSPAFIKDMDEFKQDVYKTHVSTLHDRISDDSGRVITEYAPNHPVMISFPKTVTEARAAVKNIRGDRNYGGFKSVRYVVLDYKTLPDDLEVNAPTDGRPLLIHIRSGFGTLNVRSGNVIVEADSRSGNVIHTYGDSNVTVIVGDEKKISTTTADNSQVTIVPGKGSKGYQSIEGNGKLTIVNNGYEHRISTSESHRLAREAAAVKDNFIPSDDIPVPF